jgi:hypothetical protein
MTHDENSSAVAAYPGITLELGDVRAASLAVKLRGAARQRTQHAAEVALLLALHTASLHCALCCAPLQNRRVSLEATALSDPAHLPAMVGALEGPVRLDSALGKRRQPMRAHVAHGSPLALRVPPHSQRHTTQVHGVWTARVHIIQDCKWPPGLQPRKGLVASSGRQSIRSGRNGLGLPDDHCTA